MARDGVVVWVLRNEIHKIGKVRVWYWIINHSRGYRLAILGILVSQTFSNYIMFFSRKIIFSWFFFWHK